MCYVFVCLRGSSAPDEKIAPGFAQLCIVS